MPIWREGSGPWRVPCSRARSAGRSHRRPGCRAGRLEVIEAGETDMVPMTLATLDLVTRDGAQPAFPAVRHDGRALVLRCANCPAGRR
jgi:hypothetical protein